MKKKGFIIGGICLAAIVGILGYNHEAVRVVFHNVYSPSVKLDDSSKWNTIKFLIIRSATDH